MLEMLDVAIGFAVVMLGLSLIITSLTQATVGLLGLRGMQLWIGLKWLLKLAVPSLTIEQATALSQGIVSHPLISDTSMKAGMALWGRASAIKREELIPVLEAVEKQLRAASPGFARLEDADKARIEQWFDTFMARVSQWFTMYTRIISVVFAAIIALYLHLDAGQLFDQLRNDSAARTRVTAAAGPLLTEAQARGLLGKPEAEVKEPLEHLSEQAKQITTDLAGVQSLLGRPAAKTSAAMMAGGTGAKAADAPLLTWSELPGIGATVILLSLGAPFWFNVLKQATSLRSVVAQQIGPTNAPATAAAPVAVAPPAAMVVPAAVLAPPAPVAPPAPPVPAAPAAPAAPGARGIAPPPAPGVAAQAPVPPAPAAPPAAAQPPAALAPPPAVRLPSLP